MDHAAEPSPAEQSLLAVRPGTWDMGLGLGKEIVGSGHDGFLYESCTRRGRDFTVIRRIGTHRRDARVRQQQVPLGHLCLREIAIEITMY